MRPNEMYNQCCADEVCHELKKEPTFTDQLCTTHDILMKSFAVVTEVSGRLFGGDSPFEQGDTRSTTCMYDNAEDNALLAKAILQTLNHIQERLG